MLPVVAASAIASKGGVKVEWTQTSRDGSKMALLEDQAPLEMTKAAKPTGVRAAPRPLFRLHLRAHA